MFRPASDGAGRTPAVYHPLMEAIALCVPVAMPSVHPGYVAGPVFGVIRLVNFRWRPCRRTARLLDVAGVAWPHRAAAIEAIRRAMLARRRRYMLRTVSHCAAVEGDRARLAAWRW